MSKDGSTSFSILVKSHSVPLGLPGQIHGRPTVQADKGDDTQLQYSYQCIAGVVLLCGAIAGKNGYNAIWMEHHDDLLADCGGGQYDAIQSKTTLNAGTRWKCTHEGFIDAVRKQCKLEHEYGDQIRHYVLFSNIKPYVPTANTKKPETFASSPTHLIDECKKKSSFTRLNEPYKTVLKTLSDAVGYAPDVVFRVMQKLLFQKGPQLEAFRDQLATIVSEVPECENLPMSRLREAGQQVYQRMHYASIKDASTLSLLACPLAPDGRELASIEAKKITADEVRQILMRHPGENFLYDAQGQLKLGKLSGQKAVLRQKMELGGVGGQFSSIWLQAISAEKHLMEEMHLDPKRGLQKLNQLEAVMIVECQNAEAEFSDDPEETRGPRIFRRILARTEQLSSGDGEQVFNVRVETLRGMAGLLSGSCYFAWGKSLPLDFGVVDGV